MDAEQPRARASGSLSVGRAVAVLIGFVVAVAVLVAWGTRPSVSTTAAPTTTTTAASPTTAAGGATSTTATTARSTTTTAHGQHGHKGSTTTTTVPPSSVSVVVANATSTSGLAAHYTSVLGPGGWSMKTPVDATTSEATSAVYYAAGFQQEAESIASAIGVKPTAVVPLTSAVPVTGVTGTDVVVVIGQDLASTTTATTAG